MLEFLSMPSILISSLSVLWRDCRCSTNAGLVLSRSPQNPHFQLLPPCFTTLCAALDALDLSTSSGGHSEQR